MTTCEWKGEAICEHCHKSVAYRVITAITCVTWRPNMAVCQVMMDCLTAVHRDNTQPIKHVLTTSRNNNLKTKKNIDNKNTKKHLVYSWDFDWYKAWELWLFSVLWSPPFTFCFRWLIIPQNNQTCCLCFHLETKNQQITENSYLVLINQKPLYSIYQLFFK